MFIVIYSFRVKQGLEQAFEESWKEITKAMLKDANSRGSRLHRSSDTEYIAYAQWPTKQHWEDAGNHLPADVDRWRAQMKESCLEIKTLYELQQVDDLLIK